MAYITGARIPYTKEELSILPQLREFIAVIIFYAMRGSTYDLGLADRVLPQWRDDIIIPYYRRFIRGIKKLYLMERVWRNNIGI